LAEEQSRLETRSLRADDNEAQVGVLGTPRIGVGTPVQRGPDRWWTFSRLGPIAVMLAPIVFNAIELRSEIRYLPYANDSAFHAEMVRYATAQLRAGHFPLDGWFPYLNFGQPFFMHYQSLGAILAGVLGLAIGPNQSFSLCLYLLLVTWPLSVYLGARLFGLSRWTSAFAALASAFITSATSIGFEQGAYVWIGFGVWSQLWAMWTLPLAWGFTWRAINDGRNTVWACVFIALTAAFHYETGYLAFLSIVLWTVVGVSDFAARVKRAFVVAIGSLALSAWVIVPLLVFRHWTSINEFLQNSPDVNSYGARRVLIWLFTGRILDFRRVPVISLFAGVGFITSVVRWRRDIRLRAILIAFLVSLVLFFGRTTFGAAFDLLPGGREFFLRRFVSGVQLSGILLAGVGALSVGQLIAAASYRVRGAFIERWQSQRPKRIVARILFAGVIVAVSSPMWNQLSHFDNSNSKFVAFQRSAAISHLASELDRLAAKAKKIGGGETYAGLIFSGWGPRFDVGYVPVVSYLASLQIEEVGYTNRTSSLMSDPEEEFIDTNPADYTLFGVRFVILPPTRRPPAGARLLGRAGPYSLWFLPHNGFVQVVDTIGPPIVEDRAHMGTENLPFLNSSLARSGRYPVVAFGGRPAASPTLTSRTRPLGPAGSIISQTNDLQEGQYTATVHANRTSVVLLRQSFDPGWTVSVDGKRAKTEMVAPAFVGVRVSAGTHVVKFRYRAFQYYPELFGLAGLALLVLGLGSSRTRRWPRHSS
jgi:hypothetical protein